MILLRGEKKMKLVKTLGILLCFALLASTAAATPSKNSEMPTNYQFNKWMSGFSGEYLINENGVYLCDAAGDKLKIRNNRYAHNPTYENLMDFLDKNDIDKRDYEYPTYTCGNFAVDLHDAAEKKFIRAGIVCALNDDGDFDHAFNVFQTTDKGTVFIDCTSGYDGEKDLGDCIAHIGNAMEGYTITSIDNPEESVTIEWKGTVYYEYFW
jgi:hypothetical protein